METPQVYQPKSKTYKVKVNGVLYGTIHANEGETKESLELRACDKFEVKKVVLEKLK